MKTYISAFLQNINLAQDQFRHLQNLYLAAFNPNGEAVVQRYSVIKVFLEIFQNSEENTCARVSFLIKLLA